MGNSLRSGRQVESPQLNTPTTGHGLQTPFQFQWRSSRERQCTLRSSSEIGTNPHEHNKTWPSNTLSIPPEASSYTTELRPGRGVKSTYTPTNTTKRCLRRRCQRLGEQCCEMPTSVHQVVLVKRRSAAANHVLSHSVVDNFMQ